MLSSFVAEENLSMSAEPETETKSSVPEWDEYPKLRQLKTEPLFERAEKLKTQIADLEQQLDDVKLILGAKMAAAEAKSVRHDGFLYVWQEACQTESLDKDWAKKTLIQKGVAIAEIKKHTKIGERKAHLRITSPKSA